MKSKTRNVLLTVGAFIIGAWFTTQLHADDGIALMTKEALKSELDNPNIVVLDVRTGRDWKSSEFKIKGAVRANPGSFDSWSNNFDKNKQLVLYCA